MAIALQSVSNSSNVRAAGYDGDRNVLRIEFTSGAKYDYHGVTPDIYRAFLDAPSQGSYLHRIIKQGCPASKV